MTTSTSPPNVILRRDTWQSVWRFATSDALLAGSVSGLSILLTAAAILPQTPQGDSTAYARWLSDTQIRFGGAAGALAALGLFDVVHSIAFRALAGILGLTLVGRLVDRIQDFQLASRLADPPHAAAHAIEVSRSTDTLLRQLRGYRIRKRDGMATADRLPLAYLGAIAAHGGPLVLLLGMMLSPLTDWRIEALSALPDTTVSVPGAPYALRTSDIDAGGDVGLTLFREGAPVIDGVAAPGRPLSGGGIGLFVHDILPALRASGQDENGRPLDLQISPDSAPSTELLLTFDVNRPDPFFGAPRAQLAVSVSFQGRDGDRAYRVSVFSSPDAKLIAEADLRPGDRLSANGSSFDFQNESHAVIDIVQAPSQVVILAGLIATLAGLALVAFYPVRRIWFITTEQGTRILCDDPDFGLERFAAAGSPS
ncbi:MAG: cytochrome c biogenesis protein ResB [Anaerolineae bacterium]